MTAMIISYDSTFLVILVLLVRICTLLHYGMVAGKSENDRPFTDNVVFRAFSGSSFLSNQRFLAAHSDQRFLAKRNWPGEA